MSDESDEQVYCLRMVTDTAEDLYGYGCSRLKGHEGPHRVIYEWTDNEEVQERSDAHPED